MGILLKSFNIFFIKISSAKKVGLYNADYKYYSDYDYFYRMIMKKNERG